MDRPLTKAQKRKILTRQVLKVAVILVIPVVVIFLLRNSFLPRLSYEQLRTAVAEKGDMTVTVSGAGVVIPNYEESITAPFRTKILNIYRQPGDQVDEGDTLMILDNEVAVNELDRLRNEMELMMIRKEGLETDLRQIMEDFHYSRLIKELRVEGLQSDYDNEAKLNEMGGTPKEKVKKAETELRIARLELEQAEINHNNAVSSGRSSVREMETQIRIQKTLIRDAEIVVSQSYVRSPFTGNLSTINDNPGVMVTQGQEIARIADYSRYKIKGTVSNSWTGRIRSGQKVFIRNKEQLLEGTIETVSPVISNGMLEFVTRIDTGDIENLRTNQQLELRVILSYKDEVVRIPNGYYYTDRGYKDMFIIDNGMANRRKILFGDANFDYVEVLEGLQPGEEIILEDISKKYERDELKIKY